jgi:hypothetical protein
LLETPHALREQARSNQVQEAGRDDEEDLQRRLVAAFVDHVTNQRAGTQTAEYGEREGCSWQAETHTCDESVLCISFTNGVDLDDLQDSLNALT